MSFKMIDDTVTYANEFSIVGVGNSIIGYLIEWMVFVIERSKD